MELLTQSFYYQFRPGRWLSTWEDYQWGSTTPEEISKTREILASSLNVMPNLEVLEVRRVGEV